MTGLEIAGVVTAAASAAAAGGNAISQGKLNKKNRDWQEKMFKKQNDEWERRQNFMNEYNSPSAQRARLAAAGLSPALLYGGGAAGTQGTAVSSPQGPPAENIMAPRVDPAAFGASISEISEMKLRSAQADYYQSLADNESGVNRVLKKAQADMTSSLQSLYEQNKENAEVTGNILRLQEKITGIDLDGMQQDWDYGQRLIEFTSPTGQSEVIPARMMPLYLDYANLVVSMLEARQGVELYDETVSSLRNQFQLIEYSLPDAQVQAIVSAIRVGLLYSDKKEFTITSGGKEEKVTYSELLRRTMGAAVADEFDDLKSRLDRVSRKNSWEKGLDVFDRVVSGTRTAVSAYGSARSFKGSSKGYTRKVERYGRDGQYTGGSIEDYREVPLVY